MAREKISKKRAFEELKKDDKARRQWSLKPYGVDTWDPGLYDLVLHIHKLTIENAVDIIYNTVKLEKFRTTQASQKAMDDLAVAAMVKAELIKEYPNVRVTVHAGEALVHVQASETLGSAIAKDIDCVAQRVPGVRKVRVHLVPTTLFDGRL